ncbi:MAG: 2-C-methyl-D-erythritol 4-phosphate cytidylyltransferase [Parachlamydiaceae bacterium]|nr:2-C-methyl-D-erythritol 4-phosphate cytidylyltransferase [Parachlamydiaceae bacterium]
MKTALILLAGGTGTRMRSTTPKQFLPLKGKVLALHSLEVFLSMSEFSEIVIVCAKEFRHLFSPYANKATIHFAEPGRRRQDSVYNGLQQISLPSDYVCIHDSARPLIDVTLVTRALTAAQEHGAATVGMPIKFTIKECCSSQLVTTTPDRSKYWEIQTPQVIKTDLLKSGFEHILKHQIDVTDDVSIVELLGHPVKLVEGSYNNLKVTTPEDLAVAKSFLRK